MVAAFSFVIMMFNVPLPGGSTGHAAGVGAAVVLLGPWAAVLALSTAIVIQALFFGDGGIRQSGPTPSTWRWWDRSSHGWPTRVWPDGRRRSRDAGSWRRDWPATQASTRPRCAPPSSSVSSRSSIEMPAARHCIARTRFAIAVPAMMLGHLTVAGLAEATVSAGIVAFVPGSDPALLAVTGGALEMAERPGGAWAGSDRGALGSRCFSCSAHWASWLREAAGGNGQPRVSAIHTRDRRSRPPRSVRRRRRAPRLAWPGWRPCRRRPCRTMPRPGCAVRPSAHVLSGMVGTGLVILMCIAVGWLTRRRRGGAIDTAGR